jgi:hypothetical protein
MQLKDWDVGLLTPTTLENVKSSSLLYAHEADIVQQQSNTELLDMLNAKLIDVIKARPQLDTKKGFYLFVVTAGSWVPAHRHQMGFVPVCT